MQRILTILTLGLMWMLVAGPSVGAQERGIPPSVPESRLLDGASLSLSPPNRSVQVDDIFTLDIVADTGAAGADTVDAYLDFDPTYLEVVDAAGAPATRIELNTAVFGGATFNAVDNAAGQINFSATRFSGPLSGVFTAATIRFRARAAADATEVRFVRSGARISELYAGGEALNASLTHGTVQVICPDFVEPSGVDVGDVQFVAGQWRQPAAGQSLDCDGDGVVTILDISCVVKALGNSCSAEIPTGQLDGQAPTARP